MLRLVYGMHPAAVLLLILLAGFGWSWYACREKKHRFALLNTAALCVTLALVLSITILSRKPRTGNVVWKPFAILAAARKQPELYREMLMNVFLFFPLGLTISNTLPRKWSRWGRIALTTALCCVLSVGIEYAQYLYALGMAETDDVICNTLGGVLGACFLLVAHGIQTCRERRARRE